jgi:pyruvate/2-oxoglutarate dehydrogenase complex dihydrolipoamide dehydrogenase (E3) component
MQAAITSAKRGHEVVLCEKSDSLGGILKCEAKVPFKLKLDEYLKRQAMLCERAGVEIHLNTEITPGKAAALAPDVIIAALGARPTKPPVPGIDGPNVMGAEDVYYHPEKAGDDIIILGGGLVGLELGVFMAGDGHKITVLEMMDELNLDPYGMHTMAISNEIARLEIDLRLSTRTLEVTATGVKAADKDGNEYTLEADTIVYATGQRPLRDEAYALSNVASEFHQIGDCRASRSILFATREGYTAAKDIGRKL